MVGDDIRLVGELVGYVNEATNAVWYLKTIHNAPLSDQLANLPASEVKRIANMVTRARRVAPDNLQVKKIRTGVKLALGKMGLYDEALKV